MRRTAVDSEVDSRQAAIPIEMSWLAEYQPSGSNLWFIHDWGIASVLGYLRDRWETESTERRLYPGRRWARDWQRLTGIITESSISRGWSLVEPDGGGQPCRSRR